MAVNLVDDDTGYIISIFKIYGRWVIFLRHPKTGRFIERLDYITIREYSHLSEDYKRPPKYLELDVYSGMTLYTEDLNKLGLETEYDLRAWLKKLDKTFSKANHDLVTDHFSPDISENLHDDGISFYSIQIDEDYPVVYWEATYKHSETETPHHLTDTYLLEEYWGL